MLSQIMYLYTFIFEIYIALLYNNNMTFKEHLINSIGESEAELLLNSLNKKSEHAVLLNTNKISDEEFLKEFPLVKPHPIVKHAFIYDKETYELGKHIYHELGYYYLQEPSAMVVSSLIEFKENDLVLDMCAAPGGKSIQASFKMNDKGLIISNDLSFSRCGLLSNNLERLGIGNVIITNNDLSKIYLKYENTFDKIILDAPCSGSGMFRKSDAMINDWSINKVYKYQEIQKELILIAYYMLKPGGTLSYSTCSYSKEEDEDVAHYLLEKTDAELVNIPSNKCFYIKDIGVRLMPSHFSGEGQYIAQFKKPGSSKTNEFNHINKFLQYVKGDKDVKKVNDYLFAVNNGLDLKGLNIYRYGVKVGEFKKDIFKYDLHYARSYAKDSFDVIELTLEELKKYLYGEQLNKINPYKGYVLLTYKKTAVDIAKTDGQVIKNYYPKGLRKKF